MVVRDCVSGVRLAARSSQPDQERKDKGCRSAHAGYRQKTTLTLVLAYITTREKCLDHTEVFVRPAPATTAERIEKKRPAPSADIADTAPDDPFSPERLAA